MSAQDDLQVAVTMGSKEAVKKALGSGADPNKGVKDTNWTPTHSAVSSGHLEVLNILVEASADINSQTKPKKTQPIHLAAKEGDVLMLRRLVELKADIEAKDRELRRPIHYAVAEVQYEAVRFLIDSGCDPLTPDKLCCSPWDYTRLVEGPDSDNDALRSLLASLKCDKSGGGLMEADSSKILIQGLVTAVGEDVNKPGTWWWDPVKKIATEEPRIQGSTHPNLPKAP